MKIQLESVLKMWLAKNNIETFNFIEEENENIEKGIVIRIGTKSGIYSDTPLTIYVSSGSTPASKPSRTKKLRIES